MQISHRAMSIQTMIYSDVFFSFRMSCEMFVTTLGDVLLILKEFVVLYHCLGF